MKNKWIFLSYVLSDKLSAYGNGKRIAVERTRQIAKGDTSNNSELDLQAHFGTHIDFPNHFSATGSTVEKYPAEYFIHTKIDIATVKVENGNLLLDEKNFSAHQFKTDTTFLIIKTGFCNLRNEDDYWKNNPGLAPTLAFYLKNKMPALRTIGLDTISLSSYRHRAEGRIAHTEFLIKNEMLLVEDMDLTLISDSTKIKSAIISPLRFEQADGTPVTVFAETEE